MEDMVLLLLCQALENCTLHIMGYGEAADFQSVFLGTPLHSQLACSVCPVAVEHGKAEAHIKSFNMW